MKRSYVVSAMFAAVTMMAVAAQAESTGDQIFKQKCAMCHAVNGKGGKIGPELTKIASSMNEKAIKAQIENPKKRSPSTKMPSFNTLPKADLDALLGYLKTLK